MLNYVLIPPLLLCSEDTICLHVNVSIWLMNPFLTFKSVHLQTAVKAFDLKFSNIGPKSPHTLSSTVARVFFPLIFSHTEFPTFLKNEYNQPAGGES